MQMKIVLEFFIVVSVKDSILIGTEHLENNTMFRRSSKFDNLVGIVDNLRLENRAAVLQLVTLILNVLFFIFFGANIEKNFMNYRLEQLEITRKIIHLAMATHEKSTGLWRTFLARALLAEYVFLFYMNLISTFLSINLYAFYYSFKKKAI